MAHTSPRKEGKRKTRYLFAILWIAQALTGAHTCRCSILSLAPLGRGCPKDRRGAKILQSFPHLLTRSRHNHGATCLFLISHILIKYIMYIFVLFAIIKTKRENSYYYQVNTCSYNRYGNRLYSGCFSRASGN